MERDGPILCLFLPISLVLCSLKTRWEQLSLSRMKWTCLSHGSLTIVGLCRGCQVLLCKLLRSQDRIYCYLGAQLLITVRGTEITHKGLADYLSPAGLQLYNTWSSVGLKYNSCSWGKSGSNGMIKCLIANVCCDRHCLCLWSQLLSARGNYSANYSRMSHKASLTLSRFLFYTIEYVESQLS